MVISTIAGISGGLIGLILVILGVLHLIKGPLGNFARAFTSWIPISPKVLGIIVLVLGVFLFGGLTYAMSLWGGVAGGTGVSTASLGIGTNTQQATTSPLQISCRLNTPSATTPNSNISFTQDTVDPTHYTVAIANATTSGGLALNGTMLCTRTGDVTDAATADCYFKAGTYRNKASTTDVNTYYMVATTAAASQTPGFPWQQTAYLKSGSVATSSDSQEYLPLVFAGGASTAPDKQKTVGYTFTLPGATNVNYLNNLDSVDNVIICGGQQVARLTIQKISN